MVEFVKNVCGNSIQNMKLNLIERRKQYMLFALFTQNANTYDEVIEDLDLQSFNNPKRDEVNQKFP